jgi:hypothetical protein
VSFRTRAIRSARVAKSRPVVDQLEKDEQRDVYRLYVALGCEVVWFSQPRATMQTEGIPDLKVYCRRKGLTWWHETKRTVGGRQSDEQRHFQQRATCCGEEYVLGGWEEAVQFVRARGLVAPGWRPVRHPDA